MRAWLLQLAIAKPHSWTHRDWTTPPTMYTCKKKSIVQTWPTSSSSHSKCSNTTSPSFSHILICLTFVSVLISLLTPWHSSSFECHGTKIKCMTGCCMMLTLPNTSAPWGEKPKFGNWPWNESQETLKLKQVSVISWIWIDMICLWINICVQMSIIYSQHDDTCTRICTKNLHYPFQYLKMRAHTNYELHCCSI